MKIENDNCKSTEDIYEELLDSQISYLLFEDPLGNYSNLTDEEKEKVRKFIMDDTHLWDFAPIAEFISDNIPTTFQDQNFGNMGITFEKDIFEKGGYDTDIEYRLYQNYLLEFEYGIGNTPVCFSEFTYCELQSEDYLNSIDGIKI